MHAGNGIRSGYTDLAVVTDAVNRGSVFNV